MQADKPAFEKVFQRQAPAPTVVVGIPDDESRQDKKEVDSQVSVIDTFDKGSPGKGIAFEHVVPHDQEGRHAPQPVEQFVMGFGIGEGGRRDVLHDDEFFYWMNFCFS